ncbi:MAG: T9SS type A sorting domain-containing protein [Chlorobi bacterium]|nr:T9SS type A sorting domain-containing protein [Chlorobiota bacterium]
MKRFLPLLLTVFISSLIFADNGDTIVIQTIDFQTPVNPGWNAAREGKYLFPSDTISFSKILMYYTLKCDPDQSPACGEWDYTTHTKIWEHTGIMDSTEYSHPRFKVNNSAPDTLYSMNSPSYYYLPWLEYSNQTEATDEVDVGDSDQMISLPFGTADDGRAQFIYTKEELQSAGLTSGDLTALVFTLSSGISFKHFSIKLRSWNDTLEADTLINYGFTTVFEKNIALVEGENQIDFAFPYYWATNEDLLLDISYDNAAGSSQMMAFQANAGETLNSSDTDNYLRFSGWDEIKIPSEVFDGIDSTITISLWQYGDPIKQPMNNSVFFGRDSLNRKVLNSHLPWSNGQIYWDAGQDGGYDRINRTAPKVSNYEGRWNYWTFTKNVSNGTMRMFLNGQLFYPGSGKKRLMDGIVDFFIGGAASNNFYEGYIDDFCVWDQEIDFQTIMTTVGMKIDSTHPYWANLRAYYKFDEGNGTLIHDSSPNGFDAIDFFGQAEWSSYKGQNRFKFGQRLANKPFIKIQQGVYDMALLDSVVKIDTFQMAAENIIFYDSLNPTQAIDTILKWPSYYADYVYDASGTAIDSTLVAADTILYNMEYIYYGEPYEILNPWEIARFITPYGNNLSLGNGFTWVYDVTDYEPLLHDSVHITAGNFQELLDLKFYMIEGKPPRDVLSIEKIYSGYWNLKDLEDKVPPKKIAIDPLAEQWKVRTRTTGHKFDNPTNCAEFCAKTHTFSVDGQVVSSWEILQECAENPLYPQGGTWIYDRAGWCPGMQVTEQDIELSDYISGDSTTLDYNAEYDEYGTYSLETHLFSYAAFNFANDASIVGIIAPNSLKRYSRYNPSMTAPIIELRNLGSSKLSSADIVYGPAGTTKTYYWTGDLEPMSSTQLSLDAFDYEEWQAGNGNFSATVSNPNGSLDENTINDTYNSTYNDIDIYPGTIVIEFKTNKAAYQNRYEILNSDGLKIFERKNFDSETTYLDTVTLVNGIYDFYLYDSGDNGISFWNESGQGNGTLKFYDLAGNKIKQFNGDFGDRIYDCFYADMYLGNSEIDNNDLSYTIMPNPNNGNFVISYAFDRPSNINLIIYSSEGKQVFRNDYKLDKTGRVPVSLEGIAAGVYSLRLEMGGVKTNRKFIVR